MSSRSSTWGNCNTNDYRLQRVWVLRHPIGAPGSHRTHASHIATVGFGPAFPLRPPFRTGTSPFSVTPAHGQGHPKVVKLCAPPADVEKEWCRRARVTPWS